MILDKLLEYSLAQDIGQTANTYPSTNVVDHGAANAAVGLMTEAYVYVDVVEAITSGGSATIDLQFQTSTDEAFTSPVVLYSTGALAYTLWNTNAGPGGSEGVAAPFFFKVPLGVLRYTRLAYVIAGATTTAGTVNAGITLNPQRNRSYADRVNFTN
jgi:hypothetical protein